MPFEIVYGNSVANGDTSTSEKKAIKFQASGHRVYLPHGGNVDDLITFKVYRIPRAGQKSLTTTQKVKKSLVGESIIKSITAADDGNVKHNEGSTDDEKEEKKVDSSQDNTSVIHQLHLTRKRVKSIKHERDFNRDIVRAIKTNICTKSFQ